MNGGRGHWKGRYCAVGYAAWRDARLRRMRRQERRRRDRPEIRAKGLAARTLARPMWREPMIPCQARLLNRTGPHPKNADDGRDSMLCRYVFVFSLVPVDKIGEPDEVRSTQDRRITVEAYSSDIEDFTRDHSEMPNAVDRILFWFARNALEQGEDATELNLSSPLAKDDLSRVDPREAFEMYLPGPAMGFHAGRQ